jgi:pimeloyl-ACP methyl ester carboxylesterase
MATFVLVHGAFYGGWCWRRVRALLREAGHEVFTPTLTGAGERSHLLSRGVSLGLHVQDVVNVLEYEELEQVILVGHSYGGMVITGVADRVPERLAHLVYLDAHLPDSGQAASGAFSAGTGEVLQSLSEAQSPSEAEAWLLPPLPPDAVGITREEDVAWVRKRVSHPLHTLNEPLHLRHPPGKVPGTYIRCTQRQGLVALFGTDPLAPFFDKARQRGMRFRDLDSGHDAMITVPREVADELLRIAPLGSSHAA